MSDLKPCPFCGRELEPSDEDDGQFPFHPMDPDSCPVNGQYVERKRWNTRPIEDDLRRELAEANALLDEVKKAYDESFSAEELDSRLRRFYAKHREMEK